MGDPQSSSVFLSLHVNAKVVLPRVLAVRKNQVTSFECEIGRGDRIQRPERSRALEVDLLPAAKRGGKRIPVPVRE